MSRIVRATTILLMLFGLLGSFPGFAGGAYAAPSGKGNYIITLKSGEQDTAGAAASLARQYGLEVSHVYSVVLNGFAASVPEAAVDALRRNPRVEMVDQDGFVSIAATVPKGIDRVGAENVSGSGTDAGPGQTVAVIDTGVGPHPDLNIAGGYNCTTTTTTAWADNNNHGTHVAGTIGANGTIIGVAPGTPILGVKVLDSTGSGSWSWIICGIDWVAGAGNNGVPRAYVANMSLGGNSSENASSCSSSSLHQAMCNATAKGIKFAVAAGNSGVDAGNFVPAKFPEVIAVSALADSDGCAGGFGPATSYGADDTRASFSNFGTNVKVAAPGVSIYSTLPGGGYGTMSGTSMASPHVAGMLALGGYATTPSSFGEPIAIVPNGDITCAGSAPDTTIATKPVNPTKDTTANFTYTSNQSGVTFECQLDGASWSACPSTGTSLSGLSSASHTFAVRAKNTSSVVDASPATYTWLVDAVAPTGSITAPSDSASVTGTVSVTASASDSGAGIASVQLQVRPTGGTWANLGAADSSSPYAASWITSTIANGSYDLQAIITDKATNSTTTATITVTVVNPIETTITSSQPALTQQTGATFTFTSNMAGATFECNLDNAGYSACVSGVAVSALADGSHTFLVRAIDSVAGADATPASVTWTVDSTAPSASISSPVGSSTVSGTVSASVSVTDASAIQSVVLQVSVSGSGNWSTVGTDTASPWTFSWNTTGVANGNYDLRANVTDAAGNQAQTSIVTVAVQNTIVAATLSVNPTSAKAGTRVTLTGTGYQPGETVNVFWDNSAIGSVTADASGNFSATWRIPNTTRTTHTFRATGATSAKSATCSFLVK